MRKTTTVLAISAMLMASGSYGDISISATAPDAAGIIHDTYASGGTGSTIHDDGTNNDGRGQLLNIGEAVGADDQFSITAVTLRVGANAFTGTETITMTSFLGAESDWTAGNATEADPLAGSTCTLLGSEDFTAVATTGSDYMTFTLNDAIIVDENADIGFMFTLVSGGGLETFSYLENTVAGVGGRIQLTDDGVANAATGTRNMNISIQGTAIPEPATLGLVAAFGGAVLFIRRRLSM